MSVLIKICKGFPMAPPSSDNFLIAKNGPLLTWYSWWQPGNVCNKASGFAGKDPATCFFEDFTRLRSFQGPSSRKLPTAEGFGDFETDCTPVFGFNKNAFRVNEKRFSCVQEGALPKSGGEEHEVEPSKPSNDSEITASSSVPCIKLRTDLFMEPRQVRLQEFPEQVSLVCLILGPVRLEGISDAIFELEEEKMELMGV